MHTCPDMKQHVHTHTHTKKKDACIYIHIHRVKTIMHPRMFVFVKCHISVYVCIPMCMYVSDPLKVTYTYACMFVITYQSRPLIHIHVHACLSSLTRAVL